MNKKISLTICFTLLYLLYFNNLHSNDICKLSNIKTLKQLKETKKICKKGAKVLLSYDQFLEPEILISKICDLKYTVIFSEEKNLINTRDKSNKILCIFESSN